MLKLTVHSLFFFLNVLLVHQKQHGAEIFMKEYPFLVSVMVQTENDFLHFGGGTIITLDVIMTSCRVVGFLDEKQNTLPLDPQNIRVSAGTEKIYGSKDKNQQLREVTENALDKRCDLSKATYDVAVLTLQTAFTETAYVKPWRVFTWNEEEMQMAFDRLSNIRVGCHQVLWSDFLPIDNQGPATGPWLSGGHVRIIPEAQCRKYFCIFSHTLCDYPFAEKGLFCAVAENGTIPCLEDLGSPLVCHGSVFGTVTFGSCSTCKPSVYITPGTLLNSLKAFSPERLNAALTMWSANIFSTIGMAKYFLAALIVT